MLYHLAEDPKLLAPLREEIEASIATDGWTAAALGKMWKLDSILRETLRHHPANLRTSSISIPFAFARLPDLVRELAATYHAQCPCTAWP